MLIETLKNKTLGPYILFSFFDFFLNWGFCLIQF